MPIQILKFPKILSKTIFSDNQASWMLLDSFEGEFTLDNRTNMRSERNPAVVNSFKKSLNLWTDKP